MASVAGGSELETKGPKVNIVCWLVTAMAAIFLGLRLFCKFKTHRGLWWDDHVLIVAWVFLLISVCADTTMVPLGLGKHLVDVDPANLESIGLISNVATTFSILAAVLSKTSFAVTLLRITDGYIKIIVWLIIAVMNIAMGLAALFTWIQCDPVRKSWSPMTPGTCWDAHAMMIYSVFAAAISGAMDAVLALLPWKIIWTLQMKTREKVGVALAMSMGIFAASTAVVKCTKIPPLNGPDVTYVAADIAIWGAIETATTIMASCIPVLRVLLHYVKSSAKKYHSTHHGPSDNSHLKGTRANTTIVTSPGNRKRGPLSGVDDDSGSDKSILDRSAGVAHHIVQTTEVTVQFHNQDRGKTGEDSDSMGGYEMTNRGAPA